MYRTLFIFAFLLSAGAAGAADSDADAQFFETRIRPVLAERCYQCHSASAKKLKASLYVDSREGLLTGGESGAAIVPGHPDQSRLIQAVGYKDPDVQMPPKTKLPDAQIADLAEWVKRGAPWPGGPATAPVKSGIAAFDLQKRKATHWCWQPIHPQQPPAVKDTAWTRTPIDRFILAKLEEKGLKPAPPADRRALIRRVTFDLIGLPPTPPEVDAFLADSSPDAFERVADRLLASPHFGERWARHWMDLVRYAETRGHEFDTIIPNAWEYRDYLVRAFNSDVPYDRFVSEHIAGDLLEKPRLNPTQGFDESVLGTGFWFLGEEVHSPVDIRQDEADRMNSRVDTMTKTFIGMTIGCARCHDHKFDAISTKDYYALTGFLLSSTYRQVPFESLEQNRQIAGQLQALRMDHRADLFKLAAGAQRAGIDRAADLLQGAADVIGGKRAADVVAKTRSIDPALLEKWVALMRLAARDPHHPLHAFAKVASNRAAGDPARFAALLQPIRDAWASPPTSPAPTQVIADYTIDKPLWWQDGSTFGTGPVRAGELDLGAGAEPVLGVVPFSAARRDPAWPVIHDAGTERDLGKLADFHRSGRTFRTPTVTLQSGNVWILPRGPVNIYADVDSHLMISGPLHARLLMEVHGDENKWRWIRHDLTAYAGQRMHFEFTPVGEAGLAIAKVIECDAQPSPPEMPNQLVVRAVSDPSVTSLESLAKSVQKLLAQINDRLGTDQIAGSADAGDAAPLADWLVRNPDLFSHADSLERRALATALSGAAAKQAALIKQVRANSHCAPAMLDGNGVDETVLVRGVARNAGDVVPRRFLEALAGSDPAYPKESSGRLQLAAAMLSPANPFTARVMANRVWEHLLGTGIVPTVDNFGVLGQPPTHPELLDYLADTFRTQQAWSIKKLIRSIVLSSTYQMSSRPDPAGELADPQDALLHRMPVRRLEAEAIRDGILAVSGRLDQRVGGPPVEVYLTQFMDGRGKPGSSGPLDGDGRRSIYTRVRRNFLPPMMLAYDTPTPFATVGRRSVSNVPAQALILMNDPFVVQQAGVWARRVLAQKDASPEQRIASMYQTAFARPPTSAELSDGRAFIEQMMQMYEIPSGQLPEDERPWADYAHVLFNVKEFVFIP